MRNYVGWEKAIIEAIRSRGGKGIHLQDIYKEMVHHPLVTHYHKEPWKPGGQPRYQNQIRRRLTSLKRKGTVVRIVRGIYSLPESN